MSVSLPICRFACVIFVGALTFVGRVNLATAAEANSLSAAISSITTEELKQHVNVLADDSFEGREAGSRGGRAAATYLGEQFQKLKLAGASAEKGYYQSFNASSRNILAMIEGSDPELKKQFIVIGAHYDHVGYGNRRNSHGPIGYIHNGADDNASGTAGLLGVALAFTKLSTPPRRSILFALWDGEEQGLFGSKYWLDHPTVPLSQITFMFNSDMIGRLRKNSVEVLGSRTSPGLRRFVSEHNHGPLSLDFTWELKENSDHWPFVAHNVPVLMLFTGLHDDYHKPSDKAERINAEGIQEVARLYFTLACEMADADNTPTFRAAGRIETPEQRKVVETPLTPLPGRFGVGWSEVDDGEPGLKLTLVVSGSAGGRAGLRVGDRLLSFGGRDVKDREELRGWVVASPTDVEVTIQRPGEPTPKNVKVTLAGQPFRWGFNWRTDAAEPGSFIVSRVVPSSPAEKAGLLPSDRLNQINGRVLHDDREFAELVSSMSGSLDVVIERNGRIQTLTLQPTDFSPAAK